MSEIHLIADRWLSDFAGSASCGDVPALLDSFLEDGWLRDVLVFSWNIRSLEGHNRISAYLASRLEAARLSGFELDDKIGLRPEPALGNGIGFGFTFDMPERRGHGYARLLLRAGKWKALSVCLTVDAIKRHEEIGPEPESYGGHPVAWEEECAIRRARIEQDPHVFLVGAGQTGLNIAARFKQMDIPAIVVDREARVGDVWRARYPTLRLHSIRNHHTLLYQSYPSTWPQFTPRDKVADWLEQYAISQDLIVWTSSTILPTPSYDPSTKRWTVRVSRSGNIVELHPAHIVTAVGTTGPPNAPNIPGLSSFNGQALHSSSYTGGHVFSQKRVLVVGACQSSLDICQDLATCGAKEVTMLQRSSTCIVSIKTTAEAEHVLYPDDLPLEVADFKVGAWPLGLRRRLAREREHEARAKERLLHEQLERAGMKLNMGGDGSGHVFLNFERLGGYCKWWHDALGEYLDSGKVKIKQGVEVARFKQQGVIFTDGSELATDVVLFATGYQDNRKSLKEIFGADVIDQTGPAWGLDEENEIRGCFRPTGHPGLWYGAGDFATSRTYSKQLALHIKAAQLRLHTSES